MNKQKISIITSSYNLGEFIERNILSIINQDYPNIEHIIVDGGSQDGTIEILKKYNDHLVWVSEPDEGQSDAVNKGFRMATGEFIGWLNADDTYEPGVITTSVRYLMDHPNVDFVYGDCNVIDENDRIIGEYLGEPKLNFRKLLYTDRSCIPQMTVFFRRSILDDVGFMDLNLQYVLDTDFFLRVLKQRKKINHIKVKIANFRVHNLSQSVGEKGSRMVRYERFEVVKKHGIWPYVLYSLRYKILRDIKKIILGDMPVLNRKHSGFVKIYSY